METAASGVMSIGPADMRQSYSPAARARYALAAAGAAVVLAGFWNFQLVDGFGRDFVAGSLIGDPAELGGTYSEHGLFFGFLFGAVAGLAATFTACNCVVFAMLPGLAAGGTAAGEAGARGTGSARRPALVALGIFTAASLLVGAVYGMFIGFLGPEGIVAYNARPIRIAQANAIFTAIGLLMLGWGVIEFGFLAGLVRRTSPVTRAFFAQPTTKAALLGLLVGAFAIGRPFPVMRDFLTYAASANSALYGAGVMVLQGLGQIALMAVLFLILVYAFGRQLSAWVAHRPDQVALVSAMSLVGGGAFFVFYWGLAFAFGIGRWGFQLGWY
jgi:hypothetical protein